MSRRIEPHTTSYTEEDRALQNTTGRGKLLFTVCRGVRAAFLIRDNRLVALRALPEQGSLIGAVLIGKIRDVKANLGACFVELGGHGAGEERITGFLPFEAAREPVILNRAFDGRLIQGDEILVQVTKDAQKGKELALTAHISLSNDYFALCMGSVKIGFSNKISVKKKEKLQNWISEQGICDKKALNQALFSPDVPPTGLIVRTKSAEASEEILHANLTELVNEYKRIFETAAHRTCFSCLLEPASPIEAVLRELVAPSEYEEIVTDLEDVYRELAGRARLYQDPAFPLAKLYGLEAKLDTALKPRVWLDCGGFLVIEHTEAMTVIDVNSGKSEAKRASAGDKEAFAAAVNREAAREIAIQLRLRNLSGIILVDFINLQSKQEQESLLQYLRELVRADRQKTVVVDMTPLGLVEITRKKVGKPVEEQFSL